MRQRWQRAAEDEGESEQTTSGCVLDACCALGCLLDIFGLATAVTVIVAGLAAAIASIA